jgi:hypothetical protein
MAKKQLKKLNQPKKYLQGGSNLGSVSQIRQNPYYIGQVGANAAEEQYQSSQQQIAQAQQDALQRNEQEKQVQNQELNSSISKAGTNVAKALKTDYKDGRFGKFWGTPAGVASDLAAPTLQSSISLIVSSNCVLKASNSGPTSFLTSSLNDGKFNNTSCSLW